MQPAGHFFTDSIPNPVLDIPSIVLHALFADYFTDIEIFASAFADIFSFVCADPLCFLDFYLCCVQCRYFIQNIPVAVMFIYRTVPASRVIPCMEHLFTYNII